ncbi:MAG: N-Acetyl-D-glucosamine ABC transport system, permease protein 2, partial [uncultured Arthrobacter sp.]
DTAHRVRCVNSIRSIRSGKQRTPVRQANRSSRAAPNGPAADHPQHRRADLHQPAHLHVPHLLQDPRGRHRDPPKLDPRPIHHPGVRVDSGSRQQHPGTALVPQ